MTTAGRYAVSNTPIDRLRERHARCDLRACASYDPHCFTCGASTVWPCDTIAVLVALEAAILDIDAHATPLAEDEGGFTTGGYLVSVGALHRALGVVGHTVRKCSPESPCPPCGQAEALAGALEATQGLLNEMHMPTQGHPPERCDQRTDFCFVSVIADAALRAYLEAAQ